MWRPSSSSQDGSKAPASRAAASGTLPGPMRGVTQHRARHRGARRARTRRRRRRRACAVRSAAICGSDLHMIGFGPIPFTLGHELGGVLDDGTAVADRPERSVRHVRPVHARCQVTGAGTASSACSGVGRDGGMADAIVVRESTRSCRCPTGSRREDACLVEPLGVAVHGLRLAGLLGGERVAVVGAGAHRARGGRRGAPIAGEVGLVARHDAPDAPPASALGARSPRRRVRPRGRVRRHRERARHGGRPVPPGRDVAVPQHALGRRSRSPGSRRS